VRILICEDDPDISEILACYLGGQGFDVQTVEDGSLALDAFRRGRPDLVLLDVLLPGETGWSILHRIRESSSTPIIMVSALGQTEDIVRALAAGADDYICKPFDPDEVRARIDAVLRRRLPEPPRPVRVFIDEALKEARVQDRRVRLSPKEYGLLTLLASHRGEVVTTGNILHHLWPESRSATAEDVQKYIYLLRRKLEADPSKPELLLTVRGFGYRLAA